MAIIVPEIFADAVNEKLRVNLKLGSIAVDVTDEVDEIRNEGDTVHFPIINRIGDAKDLSDGVEVTPERISMTDNTAKVKEVGNGVRILDKEQKQIKGNAMDRMVEQMAQSMAKKLDIDLVDAMDKEMVYKVATGSATDVTVAEMDTAMGKFGDQLDADTFACILINSRLYPSFAKMEEFVSVSKTYTVDGNGIVKNGVMGMFRGIPVMVSDLGTWDSVKSECKTYIIKKNALGYVTQKAPTVEEERMAKLRATDVVVTSLYATKLLDPKDVVVLRKTIA